MFFCVAAVALLVGVAPKSDAQRVLERLKSLAGAWTASGGGKTSPASIEVIAGGTAVMQRSGFVFVDAANLRPGAPHAISMQMDLADPKRVRQLWTWRENGKDSTFEVALRPAPPPGASEDRGKAHSSGPPKAPPVETDVNDDG
jgi:hypothetical protein